MKNMPTLSKIIQEEIENIDRDIAQHRINLAWHEMSIANAEEGTTAEEIEKIKVKQQSILKQITQAEVYRGFLQQQYESRGKELIKNEANLRVKFAKEAGETTVVTPTMPDVGV